MPIKRGKDKKGSYYQFGDGGKKYYYKSGNDRSRSIAKTKSKKQGIAMELTKKDKLNL